MHFCPSQRKEYFGHLAANEWKDFSWHSNKTWLKVDLYKKYKKSSLYKKKTYFFQFFFQSCSYTVAAVWDNMVQVCLSHLSNAPQSATLAQTSVVNKNVFLNRFSLKTKQAKRPKANNAFNHHVPRVFGAIYWDLKVKGILILDKQDPQIFEKRWR